MDRFFMSGVMNPFAIMHEAERQMKAMMGEDPFSSFDEFNSRPGFVRDNGMDVSFD